jgi:4-amino-4-deoxy-L-arabinose transferase-like glycosyltransferase
MKALERIGNLEKISWVVLLGAVIFFGRSFLIGMQPDAALYAGLSYKVLKTGEAWLLTGTPNKFEIYFEHPPFFFQWGAFLFKLLGTSEGVARAIGGIPAYLGLLIFIFWTWMRMGWITAFLTFVMAISFGHYTKYAATAMLEAPLSLALVIVSISAFELNWQKELGRKRVLYWLALSLGLMLASASKGVAGIGAFGGLSLSVFLALLFSERPPFKVLFASFSLGLFFLISLVPFAFWFFQLSNTGDIERFVRYIIDQVLRSATTNRGEDFHALNGNRFYYLNVIFRDAFIWSWAWVSGTFWLLFVPTKNEKNTSIQRAWAFNSIGFFLAFVIPFSIVKYQLPHYIHPVYLLMLPNGAFFISTIFRRNRFVEILASAKVRWGLAIACFLFIPFFSRGISKTENRGQEFIAVADQVNVAPPHCKVLLPSESMEVYRMEAFAMWYFRARDWEYLSKKLPTSVAVPVGAIYWNPLTAELRKSSGCL